MSGTRTTSLAVLLTLAIALLAIGALATQNRAPAPRGPSVGRALKSVTFNTHAYGVAPGTIDKRSIQITAEEEMHIVALEHFIGVGKGALSDNGHILSTKPENPWVQWEQAGTGMEPTGTAGYFGYCGRDYYSEVGGIGDIMAYETFPAGTFVPVRDGETLYVHCYAHSFSPESEAFFHHMVRVLYW
ncbi:MAG: hypothetical protein ABIP48_26770 [Planctomycetota bacterium]